MIYLAGDKHQVSFSWLSLVADNTASVLAGIRHRYRTAKQRRALAALSLVELKDIGYPTIEPLASGLERVAGEAPRWPRRGGSLDRG
jgi:hypothetical protein